jgi:hypothetical protein
MDALAWPQPTALTDELPQVLGEAKTLPIR